MIDNLTIGIPIYNADNEVLGNLLRSIGMNNLLIVDDDSVVHSDLATVELSHHRGYAETKNFIIEQCKTDWLMFCDHEDVLEPDWEVKVVNAMKEYPDADVIIFKYAAKMEDGTFEYPITQAFQKPYSFGTLFKIAKLHRNNIRFYKDINHTDMLFMDMIQRYHMISKLTAVYCDECIYKQLNPVNDPEDFEDMINDTLYARSLYFNDIVRNDRPIHGDQFAGMDICHCLSMYCASFAVDLDQPVLKRYISSLSELYKLCEVPQELIDVVVNDMIRMGVIKDKPSVKFDEWIKNLL